MSKWLIGVAVSVTGTFSSGLGDNLVRKSYAEAEELEGEDVPPPYKRPLWVVGWFLTIVMDTGCNALAIALAPLSLIIPLGALHILWGAWFARVINKEPLGKLGIVGAVVIVVGVALVLVSAPHDSKSRNFDETLDIISGPGFIIGQGVTIALVSICLWFTWCSNNVIIQHFTAPAVSGLLGSSSNLTLKISESLASGGTAKWEFWMVVFCTICLAVAQLTSLNHALATGEAFMVVPTANSVLLIGGTINGLVCFDSDDLSSTQLGLLVLGIFVVVVGISILAGKKTLLHKLMNYDSCSSSCSGSSDDEAGLLGAPSSQVNYRTSTSTDALHAATP